MEKNIFARSSDLVSRAFSRTSLFATPKRFAVSTLLLSSLAGLSACSELSQNPTKANASSITLAECRVKDFDSMAKCAKVSVPEDHALPNGRRVEIFLAVLPALAQRPESDPLFLFAGGPGQAASDMGRLAGALNDVRKSRAIVLLDQRGTGKSKTLTCDLTETKGRDTLAESLSADATLIEKDWAKCMASLKGNPATHRTDDYIDDLELVRKGLGLDKINIWGGSYGSRVALRYIKRYPASIRAAILDGVAPTALRLPDDAMINSETELKNALAACSASPSCNKAYPNLSASFDALLEKLRSTPQNITVTHPNTGKPISGTLTDRSVIAMTWPLLYQPEAARMIPAMIDAANGGNYAPLIATQSASAVSEADISAVQRFAVMCAEDMLGRSPPSLARFKSLGDMFYGFCKSMPHGKVEPEFYEPTRSDVPTLLLSGFHDPVTPPSQGTVAAKTLSQSKHMVINGWGHIVTPHPCSRRMIRKLIEAGNITAATDSCEAEVNLPRPHFYVSALEARP
jgi:pimeloyl-ACP methyl ester carboxylesterase